MKMFPSEIKFSEYLKTQKKSWIFHPKRFKLKNTTYQPDFYCPEEKTYYEVIGTKQAISFLRKKIEEFTKTYPYINFKIVNPDGENYFQNDKELIERFLEYCGKKDMNLKAISYLIKRTPAWASYLTKGKIQHLHFQTKNRIKSVLGIL